MNNLAIRQVSTFEEGNLKVASSFLVFEQHVFEGVCQVGALDVAAQGHGVLSVASTASELDFKVGFRL